MCFLILVVIGERFKSWIKGVKFGVVGCVFWDVGNYGYFGDGFSKFEFEVDKWLKGEVVNCIFWCGVGLLMVVFGRLRLWVLMGCGESKRGGNLI